MLTGNSLAKEGNLATRPGSLSAGRKESGIPAMTSVIDAFAKAPTAETVLAPAVTYLRVSTKEQATKGAVTKGSRSRHKGPRTIPRPRRWALQSSRSSLMRANQRRKPTGQRSGR